MRKLAAEKDAARRTSHGGWLEVYGIMIVVVERFTNDKVRPKVYIIGSIIHGVRHAVDRQTVRNRGWFIKEADIKTDTQETKPNM